ncbi:hypothetical protein Pla52o_19520 [Novipirellula galeiformis]|uniref:3-keto-alpha-glucoside-1,2-lyase/3-keto-2-hydroxy-glucal hydratase domain-containing protein n=1 Tax=Novipirellula galeiformis TaxID=2528004 RepID=A0A5C6CML2_9BACT|nr:family 16 glycoside hydrolase [Novipirellula galeiformis]TWU24029.1 hypothetical protein Pla52o_19520 [Novipirellula galeiformis]
MLYKLLYKFSVFTSKPSCRGVVLAAIAFSTLGLVGSDPVSAQPPTATASESEPSVVEQTGSEKTGSEKSKTADSQKKPNAQQDTAPKNNAKKAAEAKHIQWKPIEGSWVVCQFGGDGLVEIKGNSAKLAYGDPLTGIRWEGDVIRENYEVALEAQRVEGYDFFCGLTFPVGEANVSLILGGWGGGIMGISSIDGEDASQNPTTQFLNFDNDKWYRVRVRVTDKAIQCWLDDKKMIDQERQGHEFGIRAEMDQCEPFGVAAFQCDAELRNMRVRRLTPADFAETKQPEATDREEKDSK